MRLTKIILIVSVCLYAYTGGLQVVAELMHLDQELYGMQNDPINMALRRYAGMALTNLTFGDVVNKVNMTQCRNPVLGQVKSFKN